MRRVIFIGNPGVGKSTLLNSLLGEVCFISGVSIGTGLTRALHTVERAGTLYTDTPGLDDIDTRAEAAAAISRALQVGGDFLLVFVVTLEAGRVRGSDLATIEAVLHAVEPVLSSHGAAKGRALFSVVVNKCDMAVMERVAVDNNALSELRASFSFQNWPVGGLLLFPLITALVGANADQALLCKPSQLVKFVEHECPILTLPTCNAASVSVDQFDSRIDQLEELLQVLRAEIDTLRTEKRSDAIRELFLTALQGASIGIGGACVERVVQFTSAAVVNSVVSSTSDTASNAAVQAVHSASTVATGVAFAAVESASSVASSASSTLWSTLLRFAKFK